MSRERRPDTTVDVHNTCTVISDASEKEAHGMKSTYHTVRARWCASVWQAD